MKNIPLLFFIPVIFLILAVIVFIIFPRLPIITGYAAKNLCSCIFVAGRPENSVIGNDLNYSMMKYCRSKVDFDQKTVTSAFLGFARQKAIYRKGLGCTLVVGLNEDEIRKQPFEELEVFPSRPDTLLWPLGDALPDTIPAVIDMDRLNKALDNAFSSAGEPRLKQTRAVVVVYKNQLITEKYGKGFDKDTPQLGWSMTKSIMNTLIGILVNRGKLNINIPADIKAWQGDERKGITLHNLLQMSSGLKWTEGYGDLSDATRMLYKRGDVAQYSTGCLLEQSPGAFWEYSSGTSNILSLIMKQVINDQRSYFSFPRKELFNKIGMRTAIMEPDASGLFVGSSYTFATPRDWARLGLLYLNDGVWGGERILPEGWVEYSTTPAKASGGEYGAQIWLNRSGDLPDAPDDTYIFKGYMGQRVFMIPSRDLVVVRMGLTPKGEFDFNQFLGDVLGAFRV